MLKMRELLCNKRCKLLCYGCAAHYLNKVEEKATAEKIIDKAVAVHKHMRNVHIAHGMLSELGGRHPQLPNDTRWNSQIACLETYVHNHNLYVIIAKKLKGQGAAMPDNIYKIINDFGMTWQITNHLELLKVFGIALDRLQADDCYLAESVHIWLRMIHDEKLESFHDLIKARMDACLEPFHYLAYMTDLRYTNEADDILSQEVKDSVFEWLDDYPGASEAGWQGYLLSFQLQDSTEQDTFPKHLFKTQSSARNFPGKKWWAIMANSTTDDELVEFCKFIGGLHHCPASSASLERWFSTFGFVWDKTRNRLGADKAMKLVKMRRYFKSEQDKNQKSQH